MRKYMLLFLLLPSFICAQQTEPVLPVESQDYLELINKDSARYTDSIASSDMYSFRKAGLSIKGAVYREMRIQDIKLNGNRITIEPHKLKRLGIGGYFSSAVELRKANMLPSLQKSYAQGSTQNGEIQWRGPETGELFSYGPAISSLEYNGSAYPYDINGMLVPRGSGNGMAAGVYGNSVLRTGVLFSQALNIQANHYVNGVTNWNSTLRIGNSAERMFIEGNRNTSQSLMASFKAIIAEASVTATYSHLRNKFSNSNRNGFLNRVYQNALLTPVSFENAQETILGNGQRSYGNEADNPLFLLQDNGNSSMQSRHNGSIAIERRFNKFSFVIVQSIDKVQENNTEMYKPGTAYFPGGITTERKKNDNIYFLKVSPSLTTDYGSYFFDSKISANYVFTNAGTSIDYTSGPSAYSYKRSTQDISFNYNLVLTKNNVTAGTELGNKFYLSNTSSKNDFFLPFVSGFVNVTNIFSAVSVKVSSLFSNYNSELPIDRSMAHANLLQYSTEQAFAYFPLQEVAGFDHIAPIDHREWSARIELFYKYKIGLTGEIFSKTTRNDVFPVYENGDLNLRNIADHRNTGIELQLNFYRTFLRSGQVRLNNSVLFTAWKSKVIRVADGYNFNPIAGFSNVYKAIVKDQPLGAIVGSSYRRDAAGNMIIGTDGFPVMDNQPKVIANPIPDFIMKLNNSVSWKALTMNIDWEWRKGGKAWNGTQAILDYYGRSQKTAMLRNTTNYVFNGVQENGHPNNIPVSFYDPSLPVTQNLWTRYGHGGIAEEYIQKTDQVRLQSLSLSYKFIFKRGRMQFLTLSSYINNIVLWSAYKGADPGNRLLYDQPNTSGLDFFNLPATKTYGASVSIQF
jgi:uncharacterized membrane protein